MPRALLFVPLLVAAAWGQHTGGSAAKGHTAAPPPPRVTGNITDPSFAGRVGASVRGVGSQAGQRRAGNGRTLLVPYPIYGGYGFYGNAYDTPPAAPEPISPAVIINQNFQPDVVRPAFYDYSRNPLPEPGGERDMRMGSIEAVSRPYDEVPVAPPDDKPMVYLIALRDHTIHAAVAYWVDGDTLNYITLEKKQNRVTLDLVDRDLSKQLNDERQVPFRLVK